jgi:hypothetical protein
VCVEMDVVARKGFNRIGLDGTEHCEKKSFNSLARQKKKDLGIGIGIGEKRSKSTKDGKPPSLLFVLLTAKCLFLFLSCLSCVLGIPFCLFC